MIDLIVEILLELYMELMLLIVPEKNRSRKVMWLSKIIAVFVILGVIALLIWGVVLIVDCGSRWGIIPIAVAVAISLAQIVAGIVLYRKTH